MVRSADRLGSTMSHGQPAAAAGRAPAKANRVRKEATRPDLAAHATGGPDAAASATAGPDAAAPAAAEPQGAVLGAGAWVVLPTYNEADNLPGIAAAILEALPGGTLLVVDDSSPDGTGQMADRLAVDEPRMRVHHRPGKQGLGKAYIDGFAVALAGGAGRVVQM